MTHLQRQRLPAFPKKTLAILLPLAFAAFSSATPAQTFSVPASTTDTAAKTLGVGQSGTVAATGALAVAGRAINISGGTGAVTITNDGTIATTDQTARAIDNGNGSVAITLTNTGTIQSLQGDTFRINQAGSTINLTNLGTIISGGNFPVSGGVVNTSAAGQALDFRAITGGVNIINNGDASHSGALIQSNTDDAIRPGANTTITNYGTIISNSPINTKDVTTSPPPNTTGSAGDGIDAGGNAGVVVNNYGTISGARHGITADSEITVTNNAGGVIRGRNGSGVGSDGNGSVLNFGLISGDYAGAGNAFAGNDPSKNNGDGDGVDIDHTATITNMGTIQGTGAGGLDDKVSNNGQPNGSEGIAAGGGTIVNGFYNGTINSSALISGAGAGILIDDGKGGSSVIPIVPTSITNYGIIEGKTKAAIGIVGNNADTIDNKAGAVIRGGANAVLVDASLPAGPGAAIQMGGGDDILTNAGTIIGGNGLAVDMGAGSNTVNINGGAITGKVDGGAGGGTNTLNFGGSFTSNGDFVNFTNTNVNAGTVRLKGVFQSTGAVSIAAGATFVPDLAFTTGNLSVNGTLASAGTGTPRTITVTGNYNQGATGVLEVGMASATGYDKVAVTGTATLANGASLRPVLLGGYYVANGQSFTVLNAGTLMANAAQLNVQNGSSALVSFAASRSGNNLVLTAQRKGYDSAGSTGDQGAVGGALNAMGQGGQGGPNTATGKLLGALDALPNSGAVSNALNQMQPTSGATVQTATMSSQTGFFQSVDQRVTALRDGIDTMTGRAAGDGGLAGRGWLRAFGNKATQDARGGVDGYGVTSGGIAAGIDKNIDPDTIVGATLGYSHADVDRSGNLAGSGVDIDSVQAALYASRSFGAWYLDGSLGYGHNRYSSTRQVSFTGFSETERGSFNGHMFTARVGAGYRMPLAGAWAVRWLGAAQYAYLRTDGYTENGGAAALNVASGHGTSVLTQLGGQLERAFGESDKARYLGYAKALWQHEFGQTMQTSASFVGGSPSFTTAGLTQARDAAILGIGISGSNRKGFTLSAGYDAELRAQYTSHTVQVKAQWTF